MREFIRKLLQKPIHQLCLKLSLILNIIYPSPEHLIIQTIHLWVYIFYCTVYTVILYLLHLLYVTETSTQKLFSCMFIGACLNCTALILINYWNREKFLKCYHHVLNIKNNRVIQTVEKLISTELLYLLIIFTVQSTIIMLYPIVLAMINEEPLGSELTMVVSQYSFWDPSNPVGYIGALISQVLNVSPALFALMGQTVFVFTMYLVFEGNYQEFVDNIRRIDNRPNDSINSTLTDEEYLKELILYHRDISTMIKDYTQAIELMITMTISQYTVFSTFTVYIVVSTPKNYLINFKMLTISSLLIMFAVPCYVGEFISHMNKEFQFELYSLDWFTKSTKFRKEFNLFQMFLTKTFTIRFFGKYAVNYSLFVSVMQKIYLIVQFLLIMKQKGSL